MNQLTTTGTLFLASTSASRKKLLTDADIPFCLATQAADETACTLNTTIAAVVSDIALRKMNCVVIPTAQNGEHCFVVTADTLSQDSQGTISGKPATREDAISMIKAARNGMRTGTAFCLDKKIYQNGV